MHQRRRSTPLHVRTAPLLMLIPAGLLHADSARGQTERPLYVINATVTDRGVEGTAELHVPASLLDEGAVRLDQLSAGRIGDAPRLRILEVIGARGRPAEALSPDDDVLRFTATATGDTARLQVHFQAPFDNGIEQLGYHLFSSHRPATRWYPEVQAPDGSHVTFADYEVRLTWPDTLTVLATGAEEEDVALRGHRRARFRAVRVEGFALAVAAGYQRERLERHGLSIDVMAPPDLMGAYRRAGERALEAAAFYRELYGFFPVARLGIVPGPERFSGGFPMPGIFMIHRGNLTDQFTRFITAHELGHYYWGLYVLGDRERLDWLMLANGIMADQLYLAQHSGRTLEEQWRTRGEGDWMGDFLRAHVANWEQRMGLDPRAADVLYFDYNTTIRHGKSATGLYLQARLLGVDRFVAFQKSLLEEFRHQPLPEDTFIARLEGAGAGGARKFFDGWRRGDASIAYEVVANDAAADGLARLLTFQQTGTVAYPLTVEVEGQGGMLRRSTLSPDSARQVVRVDLEGPITVRLDPDGAVPTWNSDHPGIRRIFIHALYEAGLIGPFLTLAEDYLAAHEDVSMRQRLQAMQQRLGR